MKRLKAEVIAMAKKGIQPKQITRDLNINQSTVYEYLRQGRQEGINIPSFKGKNATSKDELSPQPAPDHKIALPARLFNMVSQKAQREGRTATEYVIGLCETAAFSVDLEGAE